MSVEQERPKPATFLEKIIQPDASVTEIGAKRQAQFLASASLVLAIVSIGGLLVTLALSLSGMPDAGRMISAFAILGVVSLASYWLSRTPNAIAGAVVLVAGVSVIGLWLTGQGIPPTMALLSTLPLAFIVGSILLPLWGMLVLVVADLVIALTIPLQMTSIPFVEILTPVSLLAAIGVFVMVTNAFRNSVESQRLKEIIDANWKLRELRDSLEKRVEARTRQVRLAAEVSQKIVASLSLEELLGKTADLIVDEFGYYHAGVFLLDETRKTAILRAAHGPAAEQMLGTGHRLEVGSASIIGWVTANKQPRLASNVSDDPVHLQNQLLPETQAEIGVPILSNDEVIGALDVQSTNANAFDPDTISMLQTIAGQVAAAIQNIRFIEAAQVNLQGVSEVYRISYQITQAKSSQEIYLAAGLVFKRTPNPAILMVVENNKLVLATSTVTALDQGPARRPEALEIDATSLFRLLEDRTRIVEVVETSHLDRTAPDERPAEAVAAFFKLPADLRRLLQRARLTSAALIPVSRNDQPATLLIVGSDQKEPLAISSVEPYTGVAELVTSALERIRGEQDIENRLGELEAITATSQDIAAVKDMQSLYSLLHERVRQYMGENNFLIALFETSTDSVSIPYLYETDPIEGGRITSIEPFPLGEGLTSVLIRTKQPLMIVHDTERTTATLGAKVIGKPAKSWLGAPLIIAGEPIGAIVVQDVERDYAFDNGDLRFLTTLATQVAGAIYNARLLDETRRRALHLQTAAEIARDISGSLDLNELLANAVGLINQRFNYYFSAIFLVEPNGEYVAIREGTGEAGAQMKRMGQKLPIGSKSIIGAVSAGGESLVVNDTDKDSTYLPDPLLGDTRAEAAIPLKVGPRILGVLDVQSSQAYSFYEEDVNVLRVLADQLAVAVINSELFAETQEHLSQHRLLHHVTTAAASGTTIEEALNSATQGLQVTLGGDRVAIMLANKEKKLLEIKSVAGYSEDVKQVVIPYGSGITGWAASHLQPQRIADVTQDPRYIQVGSNVRSELAIPLVYRSELLGVLNVESDQIGAYSENDEELLGTLGGTLAAIISNARLLDQIRRQVDRERLLYEVTSKIRRSTDMQTIMATTTSELSKILGARRAEIKIDVSDESKNNPAERPGS